jgi:hypothetical protein
MRLLLSCGLGRSKPFPNQPAARPRTAGCLPRAQRGGQVVGAQEHQPRQRQRRRRGRRGAVRGPQPPELRSRGERGNGRGTMGARRWELASAFIIHHSSFIIHQHSAFCARPSRACAEWQRFGSWAPCTVIAAMWRDVIHVRLPRSRASAWGPAPSESMRHAPLVAACRVSLGDS